MAPKRKLPARTHYSDSSGSKANKRSEDSSPAKKVFKVTNENRANDSPSKSRVKNGESATDFDHRRVEEKYGIVQREFYPPEMSNERCAMYNNNEIPRPIEVLEQTIKETQNARAKIKAGDAVLHWFKRDLRTFDNRGLSLAARKAKENKIPLACLFVVSPEDYQAHCTAPARVDFELRTLEVLKRDLEELDIPLLVVTKDERRDIPGYIVGICEEWGVKNVYCNIEYEVDELRREAKLIKMCLDKGISFVPVHDDVVVPPGHLQTGSGKQYAVYSPWFRAWTVHVHSHPELLEASERPGKNPASARQKFKDVFESPIPAAPDSKKLTNEEKEKFAHLWPAGEHEAQQRLEKFLKEKVKKYKDTRDFPSANSTAVISVHHSAGTLAACTSIRMAQSQNSTKKLDGGNTGIASWISEIAWRDFYKHVLAHWPYVCMSKPFKYEYTNVEWEYNDEHFAAWCEGRTGYPIVDAAMRQMNQTAYMHNRCRICSIVLVQRFVA